VKIFAAAILDAIGGKPDTRKMWQNRTTGPIADLSVRDLLRRERMAEAVRRSPGGNFNPVAR
jgi:hypothetical protein